MYKKGREKIVFSGLIYFKNTGKGKLPNTYVPSYIY